MYPLTKDLVGDVTRRGRPLITKWPREFDTIFDAERYAGDVLASKHFNYRTGDRPYHIQRQVEDRALHLLAGDAFKAGAFKLHEPPPSSEVLNQAVTDGVELALSTIKYYPSTFGDINLARNYIRDICKGVGLQYKDVQGIHASQVALYVHFHTAKQAYAANKFTLEQAPSPEQQQRPRKRARIDSGPPLRGGSSYNLPSSIHHHHHPPTLLSFSSSSSSAIPTSSIPSHHTPPKRQLPTPPSSSASTWSPSWLPASSSLVASPPATPAPAPKRVDRRVERRGDGARVGRARQTAAPRPPPPRLPQRSPSPEAAVVVQNAIEPEPSADLDNVFYGDLIDLESPDPKPVVVLGGDEEVEDLNIFDGI